MEVQQTAASNMQMAKTSCLFAIFLMNYWIFVQTPQEYHRNITEILRFDAHVSVRFNQSQNGYGVKKKKMSNQQKNLVSFSIRSSFDDYLLFESVTDFWEKFGLQDKHFFWENDLILFVRSRDRECKTIFHWSKCIQHQFLSDSRHKHGGWKHVYTSDKHRLRFLGLAYCVPSKPDNGGKIL